MESNANKRPQMQANADSRPSEIGPTQQTNADKGEQTHNQRITPPFAHPPFATAQHQHREEVHASVTERVRLSAMQANAGQEI